MKTINHLHRARVKGTDMEGTSFRKRMRQGLILLGLGAALIGMPLQRAAATKTPGNKTLVSSADTTIIYAPTRFYGDISPGAEYDESFTADSVIGKRFLIEIVNGSPATTNIRAVVDSQQWIGSTELNSGATFSRVIDVGTTGSHDMTLYVVGSHTAWLTLRVVRVTEPTFIIYPMSGSSKYGYFVKQTGTTIQADTFVQVAAADTPYTMRAINGNPGGTNRTTTATIKVGTSQTSANTVINGFTTGIAAITRNFSVVARDSLIVTNSTTSSRVRVQVTGNDKTVPTVTLTSPSSVDTLFTTSSGVHLAGTVADETPGWLTCADVTPWLSPTTHAATSIQPPSASFSDSFALSEGGHKLRIQDTNSAKLTTTLYQWVVRDTTRPQLSVLAPHDTTTSDSTIAIWGTWADSSFSYITVDGDTIASGRAGTFSKSASYYPLDYGANRIVFRGTDKAGNQAEVPRLVYRKLPTQANARDSLVSAPDANSFASTQFYQDARFLLSTTDSLESGADTTQFIPALVSIVRGKVTARDFSALPRVSVSILNHPEFGTALSRADGTYDLLVNGGRDLVIRLQRVGFLEVQRMLRVPANDFAIVDEVALVGRSNQRNVVSLTAGQLVRGRFASDANGDRTLLVRFAAGTSAKISKAGTDSATISAMRLHLTEYTVGNDGPKSMPGQLPPSSAYTYCVDFGVEEADSIGQLCKPTLPAPDVIFSQPVTCYVRNFLGYPVGTRVPNGYYERRVGSWSASQDGYVLALAHDSVGVIGFDVTGDGRPDSAVTFRRMGFTADDSTAVVANFRVGDSFWWEQVARFSNADFNMPTGPFPDPRADGPAQPFGQPQPDPCHQYDSIIDCEGRTLGERIAVTGTPLTLNYRSFRSPGDVAMRTVRVPILGASVPDGLNRIIVRLQVAGRRIEHIVQPPFAPQMDPVQMVWDGRDAYGRTVMHSVNAQVIIGYDFTAQVRGGGGGISFGDVGMGGPGVITPSGPRQTGRIVWNQQAITLGGALPTSDALGGWTLNVHHQLDPAGAGIVYLGNGEVLPGGDLTIRAITPYDYCTTTEPTSIDQLHAQNAVVAWGPDNTLYVATCYAIYHVLSNGALVRIAGITGQAGSGTYPGDGHATDIALSESFVGLSVADDGTVYFCTSQPYYPAQTLLAYIDTSGTMHRIMGGATAHTYGGGAEGSAIANAWLGGVQSMTRGLDGSIYVLDTIAEGDTRGRYRAVRRIAPSLTISTSAGGGDSATWAPVGARHAQLAGASGLQVDGQGDVYIGGGYENATNSGRLLRVAADGMMYPVAELPVAGISDIVRAPDGMWYCFAANSQGALFRISPGGAVALVSGTGWSPSATRRPLRSVGFENNCTSRMAVSADGVIAVARCFGVELIEPAFRATNEGEVHIPSRDGTEVYDFAKTGVVAGQHVRTRDALTGAVRCSFTYDAAGRLTTIRDINGLVTTVQRDGIGAPLAIVGPFGQRTKLLLDTNKYLQTVEDTLGHAFHFVTDADLLTSFTDQAGNQSTLHYGSDGRLTEEDGPSDSGRKHILGVVDNGITSTVTRTTAVGRATTYKTTVLGDGTRQRRIESDGKRNAMADSANGLLVTSWSRGDITADSMVADGRFGFGAPLAKSSRRSVPGGMATIIERQRVMTAGFNPPFSKGEWAENDSLNGAPASRVQFNADSLVLRLRSPVGRVVTVTVDSAGRPLTVDVPGLATRNYTYYTTGPVGCLKEITEGGRGVRFKYDARGRLTGIRDTLQHEVALGYDNADRVTSVVLPGGLQTSISSDAASKPVALTPPSGTDHSFDYTAELLYRYRPPTNGLTHSLTEYAYDHDELITRLYRPDGNDAAMKYSSGGGQLDSITTQRGKYVATYNTASGALTSLSSPDSVVLTMSYYGSIDTMQTWSGRVNGTVSFAVNRDMLTSSQRVNGGNAVTYAYDNDGRLTGAGKLSVARRSDNGLVAGTSIDSITTSDSYSSHGDLWKRTAAYQGGTPFYSATYNRDSVGRIVTLTETISGTTNSYVYAYSDSGRLKSVTTNGVITERYSCDANGNRLRANPPGSLTTGAYDDQDRLTSYGATSYTYTDAGDLATATTGGSVTRYTYDPFGNLLKVKLPSGDSLEYVLDGQNRRVARKYNGSVTTRWLYQNALSVVLEKDASGDSMRFVYGTNDHVPDYFVKNGTTYRIIADHVGSVRLVVNTASGAIVQQMDYDAFGNVLYDSNPGSQPFGFAGGLYEGLTGLTRFGARDYAAATGRWTTKDPSGFSGGTNVYSYCDAEPVNGIDPLGLGRCDPHSDGPQRWPRGWGGSGAGGGPDWPWWWPYGGGFFFGGGAMGGGGDPYVGGGYGAAVASFATGVVGGTFGGYQSTGVAGATFGPSSAGGGGGAGSSGAIGATAGITVGGLWVTNGHDWTKLDGTFHTVQISTPYGSLGVSWINRTYVAEVGFGPSWGAGAAWLDTNTHLQLH